jgi:hypothetical protein
MKQTKKDESRVSYTETPEQKKQYKRPVLTCYGDIRTRTLSNTPAPEIETGGIAGYSDRLG